MVVAAAAAAVPSHAQTPARRLRRVPLPTSRHQPPSIRGPLAAAAPPKQQTHSEHNFLLQYFCCSASVALRGARSHVM